MPLTVEVAADKVMVESRTESPGVGELFLTSRDKLEPSSTNSISQLCVEIVDDEIVVIPITPLS